MAGPPVARTAQAPPNATRSAYDSRPSAADPRSSACTASSTRQPRCEQPQAHLGLVCSFSYCAAWASAQSFLCLTHARMHALQGIPAQLPWHAAVQVRMACQSLIKLCKHRTKIKSTMLKSFISLDQVLMKHAMLLQTVHLTFSPRFSGRSSSKRSEPFAPPSPVAAAYVPASWKTRRSRTGACTHSRGTVVTVFPHEAPLGWHGK